MIIDAVYDFICPWCFVGKRHLDRAIEQERPEGLQVRWRQFLLYPHFERGGHDFLAFFRQKYGESLRVPMWDEIRAVARPVGIDFQFERMTRGPASVDGHRIVRWAARQRPGVESALIEAISSGFYEHARVVDEDFLVEQVGRLGFDTDAARTHLRTEEDVQALFDETRAWRERGVKSMPTYIVDDGRHVVTDTSVEGFASLFRQAGLSRRAPRAGPLDAAAGA